MLGSRFSLIGSARAQYFERQQRAHLLLSTMLLWAGMGQAAAVIVTSLSTPAQADVLKPYVSKNIPRFKFKSVEKHATPTRLEQRFHHFVVEYPKYLCKKEVQSAYCQRVQIICHSRHASTKEWQRFLTGSVSDNPGTLFRYYL
jgi:hypothetical protein